MSRDIGVAAGQAAEPGAGRLKQLDALRAFAILAVLIEHWGGGLRELVPIGGGALGVGLFFTLSGFLITGILLEELAGPRPKGQVLAGFYVRRLFRLLPAYYAVLLISYALNIDDMRQAWAWNAAYLSNFHMAMGGAETVFWTLSVEEQFYLLWPLLLLVTPQRYWIHLVIAMIAMAPISKGLLLLAGEPMSFYLLPWHLENLGAGCLLALLCFRDGRRNQFDWMAPKTLRLWSAVAVICLALAALDWMITRRGVTRTMLMNPLCSVFFAWIIFMTARGWKGWLGRIFSNRALQYVGVISYGVYLVHNWMPDLVEVVFGPLPKAVAAPLVVIGTFGLCALSWRFFEGPMIRIGRYVSDRIEGNGREAAAREPA